MGYIRHHAIVVTSFEEKTLQKAMQKAEAIFKCQVSNIIQSPCNGYYSFFIAPDGSKLGWEASEVAKKSRGDFGQFIDSHAYEDGSNPLDYVEVFYGGDDREAGIVNHN